MAVSYNSCALITTENKYSLGEHDRSFSFVLWIKFSHTLDYARQNSITFMAFLVLGAH